MFLRICILRSKTYWVRLFRELIHSFYVDEVISHDQAMIISCRIDKFFAPGGGFDSITKFYRHT